MTKAQKIVKWSMDSIDRDKNVEVWRFLNLVLMGISPSAELDSSQTNLLESTLQEIVSDTNTKALQNIQLIQARAMKIASWVNGVHVANRSV